MNEPQYNFAPWQVIYPRHNMRSNPYQVEAKSVIVSQACVMMTLSFVLFWIDKQIMASFAVGAMIAILPNVYLYKKAFRYFGASKAKQIFRAFYFGEAVKWVITAACFAVATQLSWILPIVLFIGFIVAQVVFALSGCMRINK